MRFLDSLKIKDEVLKQKCIAIAAAENGKLFSNPIEPVLMRREALKMKCKSARIPSVL
jgi:hypothetical protein